MTVSNRFLFPNKYGKVLITNYLALELFLTTDFERNTYYLRDRQFLRIPHSFLRIRVDSDVRQEMQKIYV